MYKEIVKTKGKKLTIQLPEDLVGKTIEVIAFEIGQKPEIPEGKFKSKEEFWDTFGAGKESLLNIDDIRARAWRQPKW